MGRLELGEVEWLAQGNRTRKQQSQRLNPGAGFQNPSSELPGVYLFPCFSVAWLLSFAFLPQLPFPARDPWTLYPKVLGTQHVTTTGLSHPCRPLLGRTNGWMQVSMGEQVREKIQQEPELHRPLPPILPWENQLLDVCWFPEGFNQELGVPCSAWHSSRHHRHLPRSPGGRAGPRWHGAECWVFDTIMWLLTDENQHLLEPCNLVVLIIIMVL